MSEQAMLKSILQEELMDDYEFDELAETLIARGVRVLHEKAEPERIRFSTYAHKSILESLVYRCVDLVADGPIDEVLKFVPYVLNVTHCADFMITSPDTIATPMSEFGAAINEEFRQLERECFCSGVRKSTIDEIL